MDYNIEYDDIVIQAVINDTIDITYSVTLDDEAWSMAGKQLDFSIYNSVGGLIKTISSAGTSPAITISGSSFNIYDATGIPAVGSFSGWLRNITDDYSISKITFHIVS